MITRLALSIVALGLVAGAAGCNTTKTDSRGETTGTAATPSGTTEGAPSLVRPSVGTVSSVAAGDAGTAADFTWSDPTGEHKLSDYRGKVVLINFWGTWCPPCRRELPSLVKIREELGRDRFEIIGINIGEQPRGTASIEEHVAAFATTNNIRYPLVIGDESIVEAYGGIEVVPTTFIVDGDGRIVEKITGSRDEAGFRSLIQKAM